MPTNQSKMLVTEYWTALDSKKGPKPSMMGPIHRSITGPRILPLFAYFPTHMEAV